MLQPVFVVLPAARPPGAASPMPFMASVPPCSPATPSPPVVVVVAEPFVQVPRISMGHESEDGQGKH
ncbi:hypothetical protein E2C01_055470 [Portunus trituberculatus]|uniref:Uncharacterized protein n=1 Tax=Portunus trituberculatus TaxID=210409 RepID=A0A5B7GW14_PORTR|nr:hypothetical protein [Portunus trituberculatus]